MTQKFRPWQRPPAEYDVNWATWVTSVLNSLVIPTVTLLKGSGAGNYATASTSYVDVDVLRLSYTVVIPFGYKLIINANGSGFTATGAALFSISLFDGGTILERTDGPDPSGVTAIWTMKTVINGDGNSHTIKLQYKTSVAGDPATINNTGANVPTMIFQLTPAN